MFQNQKSFIFSLLIIVSIAACKVNKNTSSTKQLTNTVKKETKVDLPYKGSATLKTDIEHMILDVRFNYELQHVLGKATLKCKPYFYSLNIVELDAKNFEFHRVGLIKTNDTIDLKYTYNNNKIRINLDTIYSRGNYFTLYIDYTAKPNEIKTTKGKAILDNKGLYFINPLREDTLKPRQIWTQGETQSNSCWFPTNDMPNEKITQEIAITVEDKEITLSNGELMKSKYNADGSRTDFWKQTKPHAPYLVMLAVGEFAKIKDYWRDKIEVDYYVEPAYKQYAKMIFGRTPEMMELYSKKLGVDYPWAKFSQIVVRDFVSGAMENTSAVVHFSGLQHNSREHLDNTHEDIIAHELFHQWFGDLVTCESWSNIPLNESFATYGQYIWNEYAYGKTEADYDLNTNLQSYLRQKQKHKTEPIRYHYHTRDELFDVVSYQKGACILHSLRNIVGDDAFYAALNLYLTQNAYKTVELANLRMAFEEITGKDLNWFFNQWFLKPGHPDVSFGYIYNQDRTKVTINVQQYQQYDWGWYHLPLAADIYTKSGVKRVKLDVMGEKESFTFETNEPIEFVNVDADRILIATITDLKTNEEFRKQVLVAPLYMDKYYAVQELSKSVGDSLTQPDFTVIDYLLSHTFWGFRKLGLEYLGTFNKNIDSYTSRVQNIAITDSNTKVRNTALEILTEWNDEKYKSTFITALNDSAYSVVANGLFGLFAIDSAAGLLQAQKLKHTPSISVQNAVLDILSSNSNENETDYFENMLVKYSNNRRIVMSYYSRYLIRSSIETQKDAIEGLKILYKKLPDGAFKKFMPDWVKYQQNFWLDVIPELNKQREVNKKNEAALAKIAEIEKEVQSMVDAYGSILIE